MNRKTAVSKGKSEFSVELTTALVHFLHSAGIGKKRIESAVRGALRTVPVTKSAHKVAGIDAGTASVIGAAFHRWFRSKEFIDRTGKPIPLKLLGPGKTVESLIAMEGAKIAADSIARELGRLGLVKKTSAGAYVPTALHSLIRKRHPYLTEYIAHSIIRFLHTVNDNAGGTEIDVPLIERYAHVSSLPESKIREFKDFSNQQGEALIDTVNDWLESNRASPKTSGARSSFQAGLHVFAYVARRGKSPRR